MKQTKNHLRGLIITGIFAIPFLAFIVSGSLFFPFITGKNFGFRMIVEVIFAAYVLLAYYDAAYRPKFSWIMAVASVFVVTVFCADMFGFNPYRSFWSNYERMEGFIGLIHVFAYFVVAGSVLTKDLWMKFLHANIWASIVMAFYGLIQMGGSAEISQGGRLDGRFGNAAYFGGYLLFNIFLAAFLMAKRKERDWLWYLYVPVIAFETYIMFSTETRGSMLGLFVGVIVSSFLFLFLDKKRPALRWLAGGLIVFVAVFVALVFQFKDSNFIRSHTSLSRFASISLSQSTVGSRFMVWGMAIDGFKERPLLGWGQENFNVVFNKYYNPGMYAQEQWFDRAHDIFLDWLISAGIIGLLLYLLLFISGVFLAWEPETVTDEKGLFQKIRHAWSRHLSGNEQDKILERSILTGLFASYFVHNIFVFDNLWSYVLFFSLLAFLHHNHTRRVPVMVEIRGTKAIKNQPMDEFLPFSYAGPAVIFVFVTVCYFANWKPIMANKEIIMGISPRQNGGTLVKENVDSFRKVIEYDTFGSSEGREQIVQAALRVKGNDSVPEDLRRELFTFASEQILLQIKKAPNDARNETFAGMLFLRYGNIPEAVAHFEKAHELSPKKQTIAFNLVMAYLNAGENEKAVLLAEEAYRSEPKFDEAAITYAVTLMRIGKADKGEEILKKNFGTDLVFDENLINAYAVLGKFDKVIPILEKRLESGEDAQLRLRLAASYLELGNKINAISEIQKIIDKNPDFKAQGESYINEIRAGRKP
jgi:O-antigen ligase/tetratricopeptide (TPR) repeat protein